MNRRLVLPLASVLVVASLAYASASAQDPTPAPAPAPQATPKPASPNAPQPTPASQPLPFAPNVRVEVTITDQTATGTPFKKSVSVTTNRSGSVRAGVNVPIPSLQATAAPGVTSPVLSYNYRTMGLNLDVIDVEVRENNVRVRLNLEYSPLDENEKPGAPATAPVSYSNFSQTFYLVLENGKPMTAAVTSDPVPNRNRTLSVDVKATILR